MFRQYLTRLPLRRCLHSQAGASSPRAFGRYNRAAFALGASVTVATYLTWSFTSDGRRIALDSTKAVPVASQSATSSPLSTSPIHSTPSTSTTTASEEPALPTDDGVSDEAPQTVTAEEDVEEQSSGGAFNPETGEINWDCPCLGGMAHGPCGAQFREAFSCFVFSEKEPKGIDCVEKFKAMQDCFREHPDVYGDEIMDDDEEESQPESSELQKPAGKSTSSESPAPSSEKSEQPPSSTAS
ncbi:hypothetical protein F5I97DRAFT_1925088 [Phlebopus sp. FC_14]|nr:hypothetical protein F5I97DRAFT_1925088 [Phlebopus sp. FC_14]